MKKIFTKTFLLIGLAASAFAVFYACTEQRFSPAPANSAPTTATTTDNASVATLSPFHKGVGGLIDGELGRKWISNYGRSNKRDMSYTIHANDVLEILANEACVGISLYYAKAHDGQLHILTLGVDAAGKAVPANRVATINGDINWATAMKWIDNYTGAVHAHFFGADIYRMMINTRKCSVIKLSFALNDDNLPQLLMSNNSETTPADFVDISVICPPFCPE